MGLVFQRRSSDMIYGHTGKSFDDFILIIWSLSSIDHVSLRPRSLQVQRGRVFKVAGFHKHLQISSIFHNNNPGFKVQSRPAVSFGICSLCCNVESVCSNKVVDTRVAGCISVPCGYGMQRNCSHTVYEFCFCRRALQLTSNQNSRPRSPVIIDFFLSNKHSSLKQTTGCQIQ